MLLLSSLIAASFCTRQTYTSLHMLSLSILSTLAVLQSGKSNSNYLGLCFIWVIVIKKLWFYIYLFTCYVRSVHLSFFIKKGPPDDSCWSNPKFWILRRTAWRQERPARRHELEWFGFCNFWVLWCFWVHYKFRYVNVIVHVCKWWRIYTAIGDFDDWMFIEACGFKKGGWGNEC